MDYNGVLAEIEVILFLSFHSSLEGAMRLNFARPLALLEICFCIKFQILAENPGL